MEEGWASEAGGRAPYTALAEAMLCKRSGQDKKAGLVFQGCHHEVPQTGGLKHQTFIFL